MISYTPVSSKRLANRLASSRGLLGNAVPFHRLSANLIMAKASDEIIDQWRVPPGKSIDLKDYDPGWAGDPKLPKAERKRFAEEVLTQDLSALAEAQERLYAANSWSILIILQAMDAAGKDGTIKHVMSGVNPQGCQVYSFKHPSAEELDHNFLWRYARACPNGAGSASSTAPITRTCSWSGSTRSWCKPSASPAPSSTAISGPIAMPDINAFERHLTRNGTVILKFFLHVSKDEQTQAVPQAAQRPEEALEVRGRRPGRTWILEGLHEGLRDKPSSQPAPSGPPGTSSRPTTSGSLGPRRPES